MGFGGDRAVDDGCISSVFDRSRENIYIPVVVASTSK